MGYISDPASSLPDFDKAVISFWFRVPQTSIDASVEFNNSNPGQLDIQKQGIPLLTFGDPSYPVGYQIDTVSVNFGSYLWETWYWNFSNPSDQTGYYVDTALANPIQVTTENSVLGAPYERLCGPSSISLVTQQGWGDTPVNTAALSIALQLLEPAAMTGRYFNTVSAVVEPVIAEIGNKVYAVHQGATLPGAPNRSAGAPVDYPLTVGNTSVVPGYVFNETYTVEDVTTALSVGDRERFTAVLTTAITPDVWHHILISFDIGQAITANGQLSQYPNSSPPGSINTGCRLWVAIDDVNLTSENWISSYDMSTFGLGLNDFITSNAFTVAYTATYQNIDKTTVAGLAPDTWPIEDRNYGYIDHYVAEGYVQPTYDYTPQKLPVKGFALGIPCSTDATRRVEMAEFQMYTGVTLDTSVEANRRLFITDKGKPAGIIPGNTKIPPWAKAAKAIGKPPDIAFHGSRKWEAGTSMGSAKTSFKPTGTIKTYKPDPKLGE